MKSSQFSVFLIGMIFAHAALGFAADEAKKLIPSPFCESLVAEYDKENVSPEYKNDLSNANLYLFHTLLRECSKDLPDEFYEHLVDVYVFSQLLHFHDAIAALRSLFNKPITDEAMAAATGFRAFALARVLSPILVPSENCNALLKKYDDLPHDKNYSRGISPEGYGVIQSLLDECRKGMPVDLTAHLFGPFRRERSTNSHDGIHDAIRILRKQFGRPIKDITLDRFFADLP